VQADRNNTRLSSVILAQITSNVARAEHEPTQLLIRQGTLAARAAGLLTDSAIKCETLATISKRRIIKRIGHLLPEQMRQLEACLSASLDLPQPTP
jgi:mRNA-degrading endonuclease toxin of MazEF toxin-antitoxin module